MQNLQNALFSMSTFWRMLHFVQIFPSFGTSVSSGDTAAVRKARNSSTIYLFLQIFPQKTAALSPR